MMQASWYAQSVMNDSLPRSDKEARRRCLPGHDVKDASVKFLMITAVSLFGKVFKGTGGVVVERIVDMADYIPHSSDLLPVVGHVAGTELGP